MTGATLIAEIGFGAPTGTGLYLDDAVRGKLDTATLGADDVFYDITAYVSSANFRTGADRTDTATVAYSPGGGTLILRNEDGRFDPEYLAGPYVAAGISLVAPMARVRFRAVYGALSYVLWSGYADDFLIDDELRRSTVTVPLSDALSVFAANDRGTSAPAGGSELTGARITRILNSLGWDATDRVIGTGLTTLQATDLSGNGLDELQLTADAEIGEFYIDAEGRAVFRDRNAMLTETRSTVSNGTFGDQDPEMRYTSVARDKSRQSVYNRVAITRVGGTEQVADNAASQTQYLIRTHRRTDLPLETDATALDYANFVLGQVGDPETRFSAMTLRPDRDPDDLFPHALGRRLGDRITVRRRPPHAALIERDCFIRGIAWSIQPRLGSEGYDWTVGWVLQSATRWSFLVLDDAVLGRLDYNRLAY